MADRASIAIRSEQARKRLGEIATQFSDRFGVEPLELSMQGRDPELVHAIHLESLAAHFERVYEAVGGGITTVDALSDYESMTKAELVLEANQRKIDMTGMKTKAEIIDALLASDGVTEDEQAEMDGAEAAESE